MALGLLGQHEPQCKLTRPFAQSLLLEVAGFNGLHPLLEFPKESITASVLPVDENSRLTDHVWTIQEPGNSIA
jgi:hypothetical protein